MKKIILIVIALLAVQIGQSQKKKDLIKEVAKLKSQAKEIQQKLQAFEAAKKVDLNDSLQNFSYAFGVSVGSNLKAIGFDSLAYTTFSVAIEDAINGNEKMAVEDAQRIIQSTIQKAQEAEAKKLSEAGSNFLKENGKREGVTTTASGLQYEVLKEGTGPIPVASDRIKVHYTGMLIDGTVFDSSVERGTPAVFGVTQVIKGWQEALQLMPVGSKWKVFIPHDIAYGANGSRGAIPPYAALIFEMELLGIE